MQREHVLSLSLFSFSLSQTHACMHAHTHTKHTHTYRYSCWYFTLTSIHLYSLTRTLKQLFTPESNLNSYLTHKLNQDLRNQVMLQ